MGGTVSIRKGPTRQDLLNTVSRTAFGDLRTSDLQPQFQGSFEYTVSNTEIFENAEVNGGTVTQASAMAVCGTSTTTASTAELKTKRHAKYRAGLGGLLRFTALFTAGVSGTEQYIGILDEAGSGAAYKNGFAVGFDGDTFGFHHFQNDSKETISISDWDDPLDGSGISGMTIDTTKLNVFAINYQYLGAGAISLLVEDDSTGEFVVVHTIDYPNSSTTPSTFNPNYHFTMWVNNAGTTDDIVMKSASFAYFVEGKTELIEIHQPQQSTGEKQKTTVTTEVAIVTIRNKSSYASKTNFVDILLELVSGSIEASGANNLGKIRLVKGATLGGTPSYTDISTTDSVVDFDVAGTTVTGGKEIITFPLAGKNDRLFADVTPFKIIIAPGETVTIAGTSANSATINASLLWKEMF